MIYLLRMSRLPVHMPINVAVININNTASSTNNQYAPVQEPWSRIVSDEAHCHVVCFGTIDISTNINDVPTNRVIVVICCISCTPDDIESMLHGTSGTLPYQ